MKKRSGKISGGRGRGRPQQVKGQAPQGRYSDVHSEGSDVDSDDFYHDEIDDFHAEQQKMLMGDDENFKRNDNYSEEEVMPITDDEDEGEDLDEKDDELEYEGEQSVLKSDMMESDLESNKSEDELPNLDAWGKKKSVYYSADFVDKDRGKSYREEDAEEAKAEEISALEIQKKIGTGVIGKARFFRGKLQVDKKADEKELLEGKFVDKSSLEKQDKLQLLKRNSPEFFLLADDFRKMKKELNEQIILLLPLVRDGRITGNGAWYLKLKHSLILHYCMNISFYMMLKSRGTSVKYHPVMKRASAYKKLLNQLEPLEEKLKPEIDFMLEKLKNGEEIEFGVAEEDKELETVQDELTPDEIVDKYASIKLPTLKRLIEEQAAMISDKQKKQKVSDAFETETEKEVTSLYMEMKRKQKETKLQSVSHEEDDEELQDEEEDEEGLDESNDLEEYEGDDMTDGKRTINYEIAKNKGLLPYRKKEYRNPRVRNRMKFRRAQIRRKGQVREPRKEVTRYGGEHTGIRTNLSKSTKIK